MSGKARSAESARTIRDFGAAGDDGARGHYDDPAYYAKTYKDRRHDIDYYVRLARESKGPVLEYGVGNGRIALHVARAGIEVFGVDLSRPMLDDFEARLKLEPKQVRARVTLAHGDMRDYERPGRATRIRTVQLLFAPVHATGRRGVLGPRSGAPRPRWAVRVRLLGAARRGPVARSRAQLRVAAHPTPHDGELVRYAERFEYDRLRQLLLIWMEFEPEEGGKPWKVPLTHRQFFPREVEALLHYNGFSDIFFTADFTDQPADQWVDSMVVSCRVAPVQKPRRASLARRTKLRPAAKKRLRRA